MVDRESYIANIPAIAERFGKHVNGLQKKSLSPLFDALYPKLEKAISRGMTHLQISEWIKQNAGVACSPRTVQRYLTRKRKAKERRTSERSKLKSMYSKTPKFNRIKDSEL